MGRLGLYPGTPAVSLTTLLLWLGVFWGIVAVLVLLVLS
jgi:hypothetical protein